MRENWVTGDGGIVANEKTTKLIGKTDAPRF
jgi:hypothetical protein